jgi:D-specific alpha-keto acid dehydrogenase
MTPTTGLTVYGCDREEASMFRELAPRFGVRPVLIEAAVGEGNAALALGNRCVSIGHKTPVTNPTLLALRRAGVEYVSTRSIGCNHVDLAYAESIGIRVGNVSYSPDSVADFTVMAMLMAVRHLTDTLRRADRQDYRPGAVRGKELRDLTVGVVGTGRIGRAVIGRLRGFGCRVLACGRDGDLDDLLRRSDLVTLHAPLHPGTHHLLDRRRIALMRPGAYLVNTGRGGLVDTRALLAALQDGHLAGAALDVVEGEEGVFYADHRGRPLPNGPLACLQRLPNVLVTPHMAYDTEHALADIVENTLVNCTTFESETSAWTG